MSIKTIWNCKKKKKKMGTSLLTDSIVRGRQELQTLHNNNKWSLVNTKEEKQTSFELWIDFILFVPKEDEFQTWPRLTRVNDEIVPFSTPETFCFSYELL